MKKLIAIFLILTTTLLNSIALASENHFWTSSKRIKTYIPQNSRSAMMQRAFARWSKSTNDKIVFQYVNEPKHAQIIVHFVESIPNADREIGLTKSLAYTNGPLTRAEIYIAEKTADGRKLGNDSVFTVMIHEIGHALGIGEHSTDPLSIMFPYEDDAQEILKSDIKKLSDIYGWK